ncbi:MAG: hypothetical protein HC944_06560 [Nanoarchaeota archaeon]|nr:hypothetical protein [Nanoarchaeota archaeon]
MNICDERHSPEYKVVYTGAKGSNYTPVWFVCENCLDGKTFGDKDQIIEVIQT